jgi:hypothetical protein
MTCERAFRNLCAQLKHCQQILDEACHIIREDKPLEEEGAEVALVQRLSDTAEDMLGRLQAASSAANKGLQVSGYRDYPANLDQARRWLAECQQGFNLMAYRFASRLMSYDQIDQLVRLGRERGGEWHGWANTVKVSLDRCRKPMYDASQAMLRCWQEVADRGGISVQATNIGQNITMPESNKELAIEAAN